MDEKIEQHLSAWEAKPALRYVYNEDIFRRFEKRLRPGRTLEIGAGLGFLKERLNRLISSDILFQRHLDLVCNAYALPCQSSSLSNIVGVDILHHIAAPHLFFEECRRVLNLGGRLVLIEPWITPVSRFVYTFLHHEDCCHVDAPLTKPFGNGKDPWTGNAMLPYEIFHPRRREAFNKEFPDLRVLDCQPFAALAYPMTRGFQPNGIRSERSARWLLRIERAFGAILMPVMAFRAVLVLGHVGKPGAASNRPR